MENRKWKMESGKVERTEWRENGGGHWSLLNYFLAREKTRWVRGRAGVLAVLLPRPQKKEGNTGRCNQLLLPAMSPFESHCDLKWENDEG